MSKRADTISQRIRSFVDNPITNLAKGLTLLLIGLFDASHTLRDDLSRGQVRVGHGLIIVGLFSIPGALPQLIDGLSAGGRYLELRERKRREKEEADNP